MTNQRPERASTLSKSVYPRGDEIFKSKITFILVTWFIQPNDHMNHVAEYQVAHCLDWSYEAETFFDLNFEIRKWLLRNKVFDKKYRNGIKCSQNIEDFFEWSHDETYYCFTFIHIENQVKVWLDNDWQLDQELI